MHPFAKADAPIFNIIDVLEHDNIINININNINININNIIQLLDS